MNITNALIYLTLHTLMALSWGNLLFIGQDESTPTPFRVAALLLGGATAAIHFCAIVSTLRRNQ